MSFVEDLKSYLLRLNAPEASSSSIPSEVSLTPEWVRAELLQRFEQLERLSPQPPTPEQLRELFNTWTDDNRAWHFASTLASLLQDSFLRGAHREEVEHYVRLAMARRLGLPENAPSLARGLELDRLSNIAWHTNWNSLSAYALEIRAARRTASHVELTPIGDVITSLTGRDLVLWLLHVEAAQSMGPFDDWRLSRKTARDLLKEPVLELQSFWDVSLTRSWSTLRRLQAFGLLRVFDADTPHGLKGYVLLEEGRRALEALLSPSGSPFSVLAETLSQDEALAALDDKTGHSLAEAGLNTSALATARQARLVAHEIRNALIPAQFALNSLYGSFVGGEAEATVSRLRPRIDSGIERVFKFVKELLKTSELATRPPEPFDLKRALLDAQASLTTEMEIRVKGPDTLPTVLGYRERFVLAVVNLLRNAEQAGATLVDISLALEDDEQNLLLTLDDNGPGVPDEPRERIFQRGVSLRPGGAGEGLALVREVIEFESRGKVACVEKPGAGARFRMRLPATERSLR